MPPLQFTAPNYSQTESSILPSPQISQLNTDQLEVNTITNADAHALPDQQAEQPRVSERRSSRNTQPPVWLKDFVSLNIHGDVSY
ncbi:hypothetical protein HAX54_023333, partial [Datura stramonium]|nr:hypothetical protein [Datura stramonium]